MSEIPEALRLAQELDVASLGIRGCLEALSADALLRQHAEIERLKADNERLREALRTALDASWNGPMPDYARDEATAALQEVPR